MPNGTWRNLHKENIMKNILKKILLTFYALFSLALVSLILFIMFFMRDCDNCDGLNLNFMSQERVSAAKIYSHNTLTIDKEISIEQSHFIKWELIRPAGDRVWIDRSGILSDLVITQAGIKQPLSNVRVIRDDCAGAICNIGLIVKDLSSRTINVAFNISTDEKFSFAMKPLSYTNKALVDTWSADITPNVGIARESSKGIELVMNKVDVDIYDTLSPDHDALKYHHSSVFVDMNNLPIDFSYAVMFFFKDGEQRHSFERRITKDGFNHFLQKNIKKKADMLLNHTRLINMTSTTQS
jgi:hypothetical protein